ncbi:MAG: hypothetical protein AAF223_13830, partial [Bacteroidota bacterium]
MKQLIYIYFTNLLAVASFQLGHAQDVYFTNGFRVTELTTNEAIVWTRLCSQEKPNPIIISENLR